MPTFQHRVATVHEYNAHCERARTTNFKPLTLERFAFLRALIKQIGMNC